MEILGLFLMEWPRRSESFFVCNTISESTVMLKPTETTTQYFSNNDLKNFNEIKNYRRASAYAEDTEGRKYKKYIGKVELIKKYYCN